ncbi:Hypothetical predicted protein [Paramuricea clavata]|uniref:Uncharacterized protein n=1 Tax=Paramuricea clavata TaxID=317549 RepID=A0A7D9HVQ2_PARCT|nr:Hypothetical predicted protein [Paramuricea clavata]
MYSIDGCKWKIFGARPKLPRVTISNATNGTSGSPEIKQENIPQSFIEKLESRYESKVFTVDGSRYWIGNTSLVFAKHIRLVPVNISRNESCIRLHIYGCSAGILEIAKSKPTMHRKPGGLAVVLGVFGGLVGTIVVTVGSWYVFKRWKTFVRIIMKCWIKIRSYLMSEDEEGYYEYYELSGSDDSEEHIYCEIQDLESVSDNVNDNVSTDEK